jgi:SAM-dependent methyltransferase
MAEFADFDTRGYRTVDPRTGYGEWAATYDSTVPDEMDLDLLGQLQTIAWPDFEQAVDLGCGSGRTGRWLREHGIACVDGVDFSPEMLALAEAKAVYRRLEEADVANTGMAPDAYGLVIACLVDDHLADLHPFYAEAARLARPGGTAVVVSFHPQFIMTTGIPTHFDDRSGEPVAIETHVHMLSDHVEAAHAAGWSLVELKERLIDDSWLAVKPQWQALRNLSITLATVWRRA